MLVREVGFVQKYGWCIKPSWREGVMSDEMIVFEGWDVA